MAHPSGIMQNQVSINPNRNPQKGTLTPKPRLGRPRQATLEDGRQLLRWAKELLQTCNSSLGGPAMAEQSPQVPPIEE